MLNWIKNNKKVLAIVGAVVIILGGSIFAMNLIDHNTEKDYLSIGKRQEDKDVISLARDEKISQEKIKEIRNIVAKGILSELTDETAGEIQGEELLFDIAHGKYTDAIPELMIEMWIQEDGTAIYREGISKQYYTLDQESVKILQELLKDSKF